MPPCAPKPAALSRLLLIQQSWLARSDPDKLFNAGLEGNKVNAGALKDLIRSALEHNQSRLKKVPAKKVAGSKAKKEKKT